MSWLESIFSTIQDGISLPILSDVLDIAIVSFVIYRFLLLIKGTRAVQLIKGLVILFVVSFISDLLDLITINWILSQFWSMILITIAIIFQPELRRTLEQIGRSNFFKANVFSSGDAHKTSLVIDQIVASVINCAKTRTGMLIAIERQTGLNDYIENGIAIDALVSEEFLVNIFVPNTPLHDGAAIIRGNRLVAAACFLPLSDNPYIASNLGTRHRAALGLSEVSDAIVIIVSEETGQISVAKDSKLVRSLDQKSLTQALIEGLDIEKEKTEPSISYPWKRKEADKK